MSGRSRALHLGLAAALGGMALASLLGACAKGTSPLAAGGSGGQGGAGGDGGDLNLGGNHSGSGGGPGPVADPTTCEEAEKSHSYIGCEFWPTVVDNIVAKFFDYAVVAANAGTQPAEVTVTRKGMTLASATIPPNELRTLYLPWVDELRSQIQDEMIVGPCSYPQALLATVRADGGAYRLSSTRPITVYQFSPIEYQGTGGPPGKDWSACLMCSTMMDSCFSYTNDASLLLPTTALTGNYRVAGMSTPEDPSGPTPGGYFAVTGTAADTQVTVKVAPGGAIVGGGGLPDTPGGGTATFTLNAGDVMEIFAPAGKDLSGSLVKSNHPVEVIAGISCVDLPYDSYACDHIEESVFPAETLGRHYFVTAPTAPSGKVFGYIARLYGNVDGTQLTYPSGQPFGVPKTIDAGEVVDLGQLTDNFEIQGDHEFAVGLFQLGASIVDPDEHIEGDPAESLATPVEQFRTKYVFLAPPDYDLSFVDVIQPVGVSVMIDGAPSLGKLEPIGTNSGYGISRVSLGPGNNGAHVLTAAKPVGIQVIGYGAYTSYQYPGGLNLDPIAPPPK